MTSFAERHAAKAKAAIQAIRRKKSELKLGERTDENRLGALALIVEADDLRNELAEVRRQLEALQAQPIEPNSGQAAQLEALQMQEQELLQKLSSLQIVIDSQGTFSSIPLDDLVDSPFQPRMTYDESELAQLAESLRAIGQKTPIAVRGSPSAPGKFELLEGHRRARAARLARISSLKAYVLNECSDAEAEEIVTTSPETSRGLSDYERAVMYERFEQRGLTHEEIAERFAARRETVTNVLALRKLPQEVLDFCDTHPHAVGVARCKEIRKLWDAHPKNRDIILAGLHEAVGHERFNLSGFVGMELAKSRVIDRATRARKRAVTNADGQRIGDLEAKGRALTIRLSDEKVSVSAVMDLILAALAKIGAK